LPQNEKPQNKTPAPAQSQSNAQQAPSTAGMIISRLNDLNVRMRLAEQRINQNKERLRVIDDQMLGNKKELSSEVSEIEDSIIDLRKSIKNVNDTIQHIIKEMELTAKKQDIDVIEKYVDMMDPTRYITKDELKGLLKKNG